ncbi:unnamed protein product [Symbiodinium natans]|uniref:Uncharacterized protein n=1 Tax=Symbiodinium natans TaxID=878477 RepID=A0A812K7I1_9DINO|nr:unnamed protein product [Symbiodinium natans]
MSGGPHMTMEQVKRTFQPCKLYDGSERHVMVELDGEMEEVEIDPKEADLLGFRCQSANQ